MLSTLLYVALAGTRLLQNDNFTGTGTVNSAVNFPEYTGAGVLFSPDGGYPLAVKGVDVLAVTYNQGTPGAIGAYQVDVWTDADGGFVDPPRLADGGTKPKAFTGMYQFTTSTTQFMRVDIVPPLMVASGRVFVNVSHVTSTSDNGTTIAIDTAPLVPGANWWRFGQGAFTRLDLTDGGFFAGVNHNWIIRLALDVPDLPVTVTSVFPNSGPNTMATPVVISGTNFETTSSAFVGSTMLSVTGRTGTTSINATVPAGLVPGPYDVRVVNTATNFGSLPNGFLVLTADGGMGGTGGGTGGGGAAGGGAGGGGSTGGGAGGGSAGGSTADVRVDDVTPSSGFIDEVTKAVITGDGFQTGAQVLIGSTVIDSANVRSAAVIAVEVPRGLAPGPHDVVVINLDGRRGTLVDGYTGNARAKPGCGCGATGLEPLLLLVCLWGARRRLRRGAAVTRGAPRHGEAPTRS